MTTDLSIIILSYNTCDITKKCLDALISNLLASQTVHCEIIIVDNGSRDGSQKMLNAYAINRYGNTLRIEVLCNKENIGYSKANNQGLRMAKGRYILYLNSDVLIKHLDMKRILDYLDGYPDVGALTVKVILPNGGIDPASHRGFPTLWNTFCYFTQLEKFLGYTPFLRRIFGGYHLTYRNLNTIHEIDSLTGAFYLTRKHIVDTFYGFDEDFFMYGEDLDMSFKIKELGYKIIYYPFFEVLHLKYASGLQTNNIKTKHRTKEFFYDAMKVFFHKHYEQKYPRFVRDLIFTVIDLKKKYS